jgi:hypothetical protein
MIRRSVFAFSILFAVAASAASIPTQIVVRVVAHDGKILGPDAGGAQVSIYDATTHKLLSRGIQKGDSPDSSGDTKQIMGTPYYRSDFKMFASAKATSFSPTLALSKPTKIEIVAEGPLAFPATTQKISTTLWVLPGASMDPATQDGIVLELYGFAMKFDSVVPGVHSVAVTAHVAMMCGCPIAKDGPWPESQFTVTASLIRDGATLAEKQMTWKTKDTFDGKLGDLAPGQYELVVTASDQERANFSSIRRIVTVR